ncbi:hypothetical protein [Pseudozobellia sp. WGM2]|uniref:hypothetical protein n=1 Tax=Pseudozobellia sp. WGM2 TaxID=2787625 RepID=UPI001AE0B3F7|nr:hypothetical protein [Pseudozobellia sp. WGM2]
MKPLNTVFISTLFLLFSCNDDDSNPDSGTKNQFVGNWELLRYETIDTSDSPESPIGETSIQWTFSSDLSFQGSTQNNEFDGEYSLDGNKVKFTKFSFTQVSQTEWGELFFMTIGESTQGSISSMEYSIAVDTLFLKYNEVIRMVWVSK